MKKRYSLLLLFAIPILSDAQISLTSSMAPPHGSSFIYYDANVPVPAFTFSKSGTTNTWDFTLISPLPAEEDTVFILDPAPIAGSASFPTATHALRGHDEPAYTMIQITGTTASILGITGDVLGTGTNFIAVLNPPGTAMTFPYTYGSSVSGTSTMEIFTTGAVIGQPTIDSVRYKSTIIGNSDVIAAGNIIVPSGTFPSLLERQITTTIDSAWIKGALTFNQWVPAPTFPMTTVDSSFNWYSDQSLQKYAHALYDDTGLNDVIFYKSSITGINETIVTANPAIYPNPVHNTLYLDPALTKFSNYQMHIYDANGKDVMHGKGNLQKINIAQLKSGVYFLNITTDDGQKSVHRFVKE